MTDSNPSLNSHSSWKTAAPIAKAHQQRVPKTGRDFYQLLMRSQLLVQSILGRLDPLLPPLLNAPAVQLAKTLVDQRAVTVWQAGEFLSGRSRIYLSGFKILQPLPSENGDIVFVAEQLQQQRLVTLTLTLAQAERTVPFQGNALHGRLLPGLASGRLGPLGWRVENFFESEPLSTVLQHPNFQRGQCFEVARQLFEAFCYENSPVLNWPTLTAGDVRVDRHGEIKVRTTPINQAFDEQTFDQFAIFLDELFESVPAVSDEILSLLGAAHWHPDGSASTTEALEALSKHARPLLECVTHPKLLYSREYLRLFLRKSPPEHSIHTRNFLAWSDLLSDTQRIEIESNAASTPDQFQARSAHSTNVPQQKPLKKPRTRKGLPVKYLILLSAIVFNSVSYFHPRRFVTGARAVEQKVDQQPITKISTGNDNSGSGQNINQAQQD